MRVSLDRRYRMCVTVRNLFNKHQAIPEAYPGLNEHYTGFNKQFDVIDAGVTLGVDGTSGITKYKKILLYRLADACFSITSAIWAYAAAQGDEVLKAKLPLADYKFRYGRAVNLLGRFRVVLGEAGRLQEVLGKYGITAADLTKANQDLEEFSMQLDSPKETRSENALKLAALLDAFRTMDVQLKMLDRSVDALKLTQTEFYKAYKKARKVAQTTLTEDQSEDAPSDSGSTEPVDGSLPPSTEKVAGLPVRSAMGKP